MQRLDTGAVELLYALSAQVSPVVAERGVFGGSFEFGANALTQFCRRRFGEGDGRHLVERGCAAAHEFKDAVH